MESRNAVYGLALLRVFLGILFIVPGITKLMNPAGAIGMVTNLGFPVPLFFGWVLILSEIIFGLALVFGWKVKYSVWPLVIVLAVASLLVVIPGIRAGQSGIVTLLFHLVGIAALICLSLTGPGVAAVSKE